MLTASSPKPHSDLLVLLLFHFKAQTCDMYFDQGTRTWGIRAVQCTLDADICQNILFAQAFGGCGTTCSLFYRGKKKPLLKLRESSMFRHHALVFAAKKNTQEDVIVAGERAFVLLYGGTEKDDLNRLRCIKYNRQLSSSKLEVDPRRLPPT